MSDVSELEGALVAANAGRRIIVRRGIYLVSSQLVVPDGATLVGEGVMLGDDLPTGFEPGTETRIVAAPALSGDVLTLGHDSSLKNLLVEDTVGRSGNVIGHRSRAPGDTIVASISECLIVTPNPTGGAPDGPTGGAIAVITQNRGFDAMPPPHDGAHLALAVTRSRALGGGRALFAVNFASQAQISLDLRKSVFVGGLDAAGGASRPETVSFSRTTIKSRNNLYASDNGPAWLLVGGAGARLWLPVAAALSNALTMSSVDDRLEAGFAGIFATGGRRSDSFHEPVSDNSLDLQIRGLTLRTTGNSSDLTLVGALSTGDFAAGNHNVLTLDMRNSTGSGERLNFYANTHGPLLPENLGVGNRLKVAGTPKAFARRNPGIVPAPGAGFFVG